MSDEHRHHHPKVADDQLTLMKIEELTVARSQEHEHEHDWTVDKSARVIGLAAIREARHLLEEAEKHDADHRSPTAETFARRRRFPHAS